MFEYNITAATLKGTPNQITLAQKIRVDLVEQVTEKTVPQVHHLFSRKNDKTANFMEELRKLQTSNAYLNNQFVINRIRQIIVDEENAVTFIDNPSLLSFLNTVLK